MKKTLAPFALAGLLLTAGCASETATEPDSPSPTISSPEMHINPAAVARACPEAAAVGTDREEISVIIEVDFTEDPESKPFWRKDDQSDAIWEAHYQSETCIKGIDDAGIDPKQVTLEVHDSGVPKSVLYDGGHPRYIKAMYSADTFAKTVAAMSTVTDRDVWAWADEEVIDPELRDDLAQWRERWEK